MNIRINNVRQFLSSQFMYADDEWLSGFVEYLSQNDESLTETEIQNLAKTQWLLNDLKDICPGSLPRNLKDSVKTVLKGKFIVQINSVIDIGTPAYQQYLKLQRVNVDNIDATTKFEEKIPNHRMIKFFLTDGVQDITAIEYKPMRNCSCDITPGSKILLKGPIECRKGMVLLTEGCIELLGGEVQEMVETNAQMRILTLKLGLPLNSIDNSAQVPSTRNILNISTPPPSTNNSANEVPSTRNINPLNILTPPASRNEYNFPERSELNQIRTEQNPKPIARVTSMQVVNNFADEIDVDQIEAIEAEFEGNNKRPYRNGSNSNPEKKIKMDQSLPANCPDDYPDEYEMLICQDDEEYLMELENLEFKTNEPINVTPEPFVYIKQIIGMKHIERMGQVFHIKAQIQKLLSKLMVGKEGWSLKCTLIDGTGSIDADFTSDVLTKLVGMTPTEMHHIKKQIAKPEFKDKAVTALKKAKETLEELYCIIELTILETPKITSLIPFEDRHRIMLQKRLNSSNLQK